MAEIFQTFDELELFFADTISEVLPMDSNKVLIQHKRYGQPTNKYTDTICYVYVSQEQDEHVRFKNRSYKYNKEDETLTYTQQASRVLKLNLIFYGPESLSYASRLNEKMYFENTKYILAKEKLYLIPESIVGPTKLQEIHNGQWFDRADIDFRFYNTIQVEEIVGTFKEYDIRTEVDK